MDAYDIVYLVSMEAKKRRGGGVVSIRFWITCKFYIVNRAILHVSVFVCVEREREEKG